MLGQLDGLAAAGLEGLIPSGGMIGSFHPAIRGQVLLAGSMKVAQGGCIPSTHGPDSTILSESETSIQAARALIRG